MAGQLWSEVHDSRQAFAFHLMGSLFLPIPPLLLFPFLTGENLSGHRFSDASRHEIDGLVLEHRISSDSFPWLPLTARV